MFPRRGRYWMTRGINLRKGERDELELVRWMKATHYHTDSDMLWELLSPRRLEMERDLV